MPEYLASSDIVLEWSADPLSDTTPTWTTVSNSEIRHMEWWAGVDREGNDPQPGGMQVVLKNTNRKWEPLFGSNTINTHQRFRLTLDGTAEGVWYTTDFELDFPGGRDYSEVTITCGDGFEVLALDDLPSLDPPDAQSYADVVNADEPLAYYRLGDPAGTRAVAVIRTLRRGKGKTRRTRKVRRGEKMAPTEAAGVSGNPGLYVDASKLNQYQQHGLILGDPDFSVSPGAGAYGKASVDREAFFDPNAFTIEVWIRWAAGSGTFVAGPFRTSTSRSIFSLNNVRLELDLNSGLIQVDKVSSPSVGDIVHYVGTWDGVTASLYLNGALEASTSPGGTLLQGNANEFVYFMGNGFSSNAGDKIDEVAFYEHALTAERVLAHYEAGSARGFEQQTAGERISAIATSGLWSEASIQTTGRDVLPRMMYGQSRVEEIAETAHAEGPRTLFFFNGSGDPVYLGHEWKAGATAYNTVQATFGDSLGSDIPMDAFDPIFDNEIYNSVIVSHEAGESATATDTDSIDARGTRVNAEFTDVLLMEHNEVESLAEHVLELYKEPSWRIASLTVNGYKALSQILSLDIGHLIRVKKKGVTGAAMDRVAHIIGKRKTLSTDRHLICTWTLGRGFDGGSGYWRAGIHGRSEAGSTTKAA